MLYLFISSSQPEEELTEEQKDIKNYQKEFDEMISWLHRFFFFFFFFVFGFYFSMFFFFFLFLFFLSFFVFLLFPFF